MPKERVRTFTEQVRDRMTKEADVEKKAGEPNLAELRKQEKKFRKQHPDLFQNTPIIDTAFTQEQLNELSNTALNALEKFINELGITTPAQLACYNFKELKTFYPKLQDGSSGRFNHLEEIKNLLAQCSLKLRE